MALPFIACARFLRRLSTLSIAILDIFGFENFTTNRWGRPLPLFRTTQAIMPGARRRATADLTPLRLSLLPHPDLRLQL